MEGDDRIGDDALARIDEPISTQSESDYPEQDVGNIPVRNRVRASGNEEWQNQQQIQKEEREKKTAQQRINDMNHAVRGFRFASSGDGLLRGGFGKLPDGITNLVEQMKNLSDAMDKFHLTGDNLNVSGSFDKGYTVARQNPCQQEQDNPNPT